MLQEDWGELNTGKKVPKLFVIDVATGSVLAVKGLPAENSTGQPVWTPDSKGSSSELVTAFKIPRHLNIWIYNLPLLCVLSSLPLYT